MSPVLFPLFSGPWERSPRLELVVVVGRWPLWLAVGRRCWDWGRSCLCLLLPVRALSELFGVVMLLL